MTYHLFWHPGIPAYFIARKLDGEGYDQETPPEVIPANGSGHPRQTMAGLYRYLPSALRVVPPSAERVLLRQYGLD